MKFRLYADSRDFKTFSKTIKEYFAMHGHYKNDIFIASQSFGDSDKRIRNLAEVMVNVERRGAFSLIRPIPQEHEREKICQQTTLSCALRFLQNGFGVNRYYSMFDSFSAPPLAPNTGYRMGF